MIAKQYSFTLPADYDMTIVRRRVAERGGVFDSVPHLAFKAFLIAQRGVYGSNENAYAPFYVWRSEQGLLDFLLGPMFRGVSNDFGWPAVRTWTPLALHTGAHVREATYASRTTVPIAPYADLADLRDYEQRLHADTVELTQLVARVVAIDPTSWTLVRFVLWREATADTAPVASDTQWYEVLHVSAPDNERAA
jgi:hypothetical protein